MHDGLIWWGASTVSRLASSDSWHSTLRVDHRQTRQRCSLERPRGGTRRQSMRQFGKFVLSSLVRGLLIIIPLYLAVLLLLKP
jgi:hypothetical protein